MDQIHEELKQPLVTDDDDDEETSGDKTETNHHRQLSGDSNSSTQSEECYESCDSGNSSEKNLTDSTLLNKENQNQCPNSIVSGGKTYIQVNNSDQDSGAGDSIASKDSDTQSNKMMKQGGRGKEPSDGGRGDTEKSSNRTRKFSENVDSKKSQYSSKAFLGPKGEYL